MDERISALVAAVGSDEFRAILSRLGGYDSTESGSKRTVQ